VKLRKSRSKRVVATVSATVLIPELGVTPKKNGSHRVPSLGGGVRGRIVDTMAHEASGDGL